MSPEWAVFGAGYSSIGAVCTEADAAFFLRHSRKARPARSKKTTGIAIPMPAFAPVDRLLPCGSLGMPVADEVPLDSLLVPVELEITGEVTSVDGPLVIEFEVGLSTPDDADPATELCKATRDERSGGTAQMLRERELKIRLLGARRGCLLGRMQLLAKQLETEVEV
jgi:hypothetical protein